jgi:hypothetical protein
MAVVMKLMPPSRNATNSSATATSHIDEPSGVRPYSGLAESGGYAVHAPAKPPPSTKNEQISTIALSRNTWYESRLIRGKTMSSQPSISGIR